MKIGLFTEPMLLQRDCEGAVQVRALLAAFARLPPSSLYGAVSVELLDPWRQSLDDYDLIHVIGAGNGNHLVVEAAAACGVPVVVSAGGAAASANTNAGAGAGGRNGRLVETLRRLRDRWHGAAVAPALAPTRTRTLAADRDALTGATLVIAHSQHERQALAAEFGIHSGRVRVVPPAIDALWCAADPALCRQRAGIRGEFALVDAPIGPGPGLVRLAMALRDMMLPLVICADPHAADPARLRQLRAVPGVILPGTLRSQPRLRASVYAAASVFIVPPAGSADSVARQRRQSPAACSLGGNADGEGSRIEHQDPRTAAPVDAVLMAHIGSAAGPVVMQGAGGTATSSARSAAAEGSWPASTGRALAALGTGTALIVDSGNLADLAALPDSDYAIKRVRFASTRSLQAVILSLLEVPPVRERVRGLVSDHGWEHLACRLLHCYADAIALQGPAPNVYLRAPGKLARTEQSPRQA